MSKPAGSQAGLGRLASGSQKSPVPAARPSLLSEIDIEEQDRISTGLWGTGPGAGRRNRGRLPGAGGGRPGYRKNPPFFFRYAGIWRAQASGFCTYQGRNP